MYKKQLRNKNGITLIALVITIIVLLILAGVTIVTLTGDNGLLQKAGEAKNTTIEAEGLEKIQLAVMASHEKNGINTVSLAKNLSQIDNLTDSNNQAITESTEITLPKSVNLNNFKYKIKKDGTVIINNSILPDEYQQVEYIESSGKQYIDTKHIINKYNKICFKYQTPSQQNSQQGLFGSRNNYTSNCFAIFTGIGVNALQADYYFNGNMAMWNQDISGFNGHDINEIEMSNILKINEKIHNSLEQTEFQSDYTLYIFSINNAGNKYLNSNMKLWYFKIYENDELKQDFTPCYSKTTVADVDGIQHPKDTIGLYELVEGKFYVNKGTGTFGYGMEDGTYVAPQ